ncbi:hypothetical protein PsYK624_154620 [Phanerochaete sordida]|uniref:BTB domain-containing protein n=1 Tax=Phanerochaete sordida TaxID=48140 RepID=A0A9P3GNW6_9APHY|nr:hypothetical protein PsYK624_154620 [Phanerochaete sordida]
MEVSPTAPTASKSASTDAAAEAVQLGPLVDADSELAQRRHPKYYFDDGSVLLLAGGVSYRIHRYLLSRDSPYWAAVLASGSPGNKFDMADKSSLDFDAFLDVLYATCYRSPEISTTSEWAAVLRLATEWLFDDIRRLAIERLQPIASPVEKLVLSYSQNIAAWRPMAYAALCARDQPLTASEIEVVQAKDVALIMSVRETLLREGVQLESSDAAARVAEVVKAAMEPDAVVPTEAIAKDEFPAQTAQEEEPLSSGLGRPDSAILPPSSPAGSAAGSTASTLAPTASPDFRTDIAGLLDLLAEDTLPDVATEIIRWINDGDEVHARMVLEYTIHLLFEKTAKSDCAHLCTQLCGNLMQFKRPGMFSNAILDAQNDARARCVHTCLVDEYLAELQSVNLSSDLPPATRDRNLVRFIDALVKASFLTIADLYEFLETVVPGTEDAQYERRIQLVCMLLQALAPELRLSMVRAGREELRQRMSRYIAAVQDARSGKVRVCRATMTSTQDILRTMESMGWR